MSAMLTPFDAADVAEGRADALSSMRETCTIVRLTGDMVTDPETWQETPETVSVAATGICRVRTQMLEPVNPTGGEHRFTVLHPVIVLPLPDETTGKDFVQSGDLVTITTPRVDGRAVGVEPGTTYRLKDPARGSFATAQRWRAERVIT
ncbi:hypothetical protein BJH93_04125 [Kocuria polaris]|nr:hypothetical protein [Kocuria polaris]